MENKEEEIKEIKISKKMSQFVVIGLGRFGTSVATSLFNLGNDVLAIDNIKENIDSIANKVTNAATADCTSKDVLYSLGVQNFDCAIIAIGDDLQASILATLACKELGVKLVITKAGTKQHKNVLEKIGADTVIFPEVVVAKKLANTLTNPSLNEIKSLSADFKIVEIAIPESFAGQSIVDLNIRKKYKVSIVCINREDEIIYPEPETILQENDVLVVAGEVSKVEVLSQKSKNVIDIQYSLKEAFDLN